MAPGNISTVSFSIQLGLKPCLQYDDFLTEDKLTSMKKCKKDTNFSCRRDDMILSNAFVAMKEQQTDADERTFNNIIENRR